MMVIEKFSPKSLKTIAGLYGSKRTVFITVILSSNIILCVIAGTTQFDLIQFDPILISSEKMRNQKIIRLIILWIMLSHITP